MMTPHENVDRFFPAMFDNDRTALADLLAEDVLWHVPPFTRERFGDLKGQEAVIEFLCGAGDDFYERGSFAFTADAKAVEDDQAVVIATLRATTVDGNPYSNRYAFGFRYEDGRIAEAWELMDSKFFETQMGAI